MVPAAAITSAMFATQIAADAKDVSVTILNSCNNTYNLIKQHGTTLLNALYNCKNKLMF